MQVHNLVQK